MPASPCLRTLPAWLLFALPSLLRAAPAEVIRTHALTALASQSAHWERREAAAEEAAKRFLAGGRLWVAGSIPRFEIEWLGRAGGLMPVQVMKDPAAVAATDVLVYGCRQGAGAEDAGRLKPVHDRGALIVAFGGNSDAAAVAGAVTHFLSDDLAPDTPLAEQVAACLDMAQLWAFTGDLVGACTRAGKTPTMWESVMIPGARERNARYRPLRFHTDLTVPPQPPGSLGNAYLKAISKAVAGLKTQQTAVTAAGAAIRRSVRSRHTVFHVNMGHFEPARLLPGGFPAPLTVLPRTKAETALRARAAKGDAVLLVWYTAMPAAILQAARDRGATSICLVAANPEHPLNTRLADIFIDPQWTFGDAAVTLPGYDVRILPPSGVLNSLVFYSVLAEARGKQAGVSGR